MTEFPIAEARGNNILISSAAAKIPLVRAVKNAMADCGITGETIAGDLDPTVPSKYFSDKFLQLPRLSRGVIEDLINALTALEVGYILPTRDGELKFWAEHKAFFGSHGISVLIGSQASVNLSLDKLKFERALRLKGLPAIETYTEAENVNEGALVVKERLGAGSNGQAINVSISDAKLAAKLLDNPIFQPYIQGTEYSVDVWRSNDGRTCLASPRSRDLVKNGESVITTTLKDARLERLAIETAVALGITGICVVQIIRDSKGADHLLECNARFGGASTASIAAGLPLLELLLRDNLNFAGYSPVGDFKIRELTQVRGSADYYF